MLVSPGPPTLWAELRTAPVLPGCSLQPHENPSPLAVLSLPNLPAPANTSQQTCKLTHPLELQTQIISSGGFVGLAHKWLAMAAW